MRKKVCVLTSVHTVFDTRIFHKECKSLSNAGFDVTLIAQHDRTETVNGVKIVALPKPKNRFSRMFITTQRILRLAIRENADVYHFHDPELIPVGILLKFFTRASVIYDIHENVPKQILSKEWLPFYLRTVISIIVLLLERICFVFFEEIIVAGKDIAEHFPVSSKISEVRNLPLLKVIEENTRQKLKAKRPIIIIYAGGLTKDRGIKEMVEMISYLRDDVELHLLGSFNNFELEKKIKSIASKKVKFIGQVPYKQVFQYLNNADIGLILFHPTPNNIAAIRRNNKLFEYMAAGLPIIASNFSGWKKIIEDEGYGLTVEPTDSKGIVKAVNYLINHSNEARKMGENGRKAVIEKYNWKNEEKKLLTIYEQLLNTNK